VLHGYHATVLQPASACYSATVLHSYHATVLQPASACYSATVLHGYNATVLCHAMTRYNATWLQCSSAMACYGMLWHATTLQDATGPNQGLLM